MVSFSCLLSPLQNHKSKKVTNQAGETMQFSSHSTCQEQEHLMVLQSSNLKADEDKIFNTKPQQITSLSYHESCLKSDDVEDYSCPDKKHGLFTNARLRKSQSLGNVLDKGRSFSPGDIVEDEVLHGGFPSEYNQTKSMKGSGDISDTDAAEAQNDFKMDLYNQHNEELYNQHSENSTDDSFAGPIRHETLFAVESLGQFDGEQHGVVTEQSAGHLSEQFSSDSQHVLAKSHSLINLAMSNEGFVQFSLDSDNVVPRSISIQNLFSIKDDAIKFTHREEALSSRLSLNRGYDVSPHGSDLDERISLSHVGHSEISYQEKHGKYLTLNSEFDNQSIDRKIPPPYLNSAKRFPLPNDDVTLDGMNDQERDKCSYPHPSSHEAHDWRSETFGADAGKNFPGISSIESWKGLSSKELSMMKVEDWISQIDIESDIIVEELGESSNSVSSKDPHKVVGLTTTKTYARGNLGMEAAYKYISSLTPSSSTAQMANLGLVVIPVLSAFVGLRTLNLPGNGIVRITAGTLPKGLQLLNLSRNNLSAIEGLRELTRLRFLDLSYNRISKIGHGLASCSSLRELYLAGNKISEIEGLHRLLKLNILDLHGNKIATSKGLGQLAANYASLQAIHLDGNPAQKNVGDEQLKKYLLSILPHLVYYNKQAIRISSSKEVTERSTRSLPSPKFDFILKSELKHTRRGITGQRKSSSRHVRSGNGSSAMMKPTKGKHGHLPPAGSKATDYLTDAGRKMLSSQPNVPMRRIRSMGAF